MSDRYNTWSLTINNPTEGDEENIKRAMQRGWKVEGQKEKGENGTIHYQLMVRSGQQRFSAIKRQFPRAHIEPARNVTALKQYVQKEDTRVGQLVTNHDNYPSLNKFYELIFRTHLHGDILCTHEEKQCWNECELPWTIIYDGDIDERISRDPLQFLDQVTAYLINKGYHVEQHTGNPLIRSTWRKFWRNILSRTAEESLKKLREQTEITDINNGEGNEEATNSENDEESESSPDEGGSEGTSDSSCEEDD